MKTSRPPSHSSPPAPQETAAPPFTDFAPGLEAAFPSEFQECDCEIECVEGRIPDFVRGTYYLNGPARFGRNALSYRHWLDGDGMVCSLHFTENAVRLRSRYIRSTKVLCEETAGQPLFRTFGTTFEGSRLNFAGNGLESPVNVSIYPFRDRLFAFGEQGLPWELDPLTLETRGQFTFDGRLNDASPFAAHPKFDPHSGEMFNFGVFFSAQAPRIYFYCFGPEGLRYRKAVPLEYPCSVHDFSLSKRHAVLYLSPYLLDVQGLLRDGRTVLDSLHWEPERGSRLLVVARSNGEQVASLPAGKGYCLHLINSFEEEDRLMVDVLEFDEPLYSHYQPIPDLFQTVGRGCPVRFTIDLKKNELIGRRALSYCSAPDFAAMDPHRAMGACDEFWMLGISATGKPGRKFFDQLAHATWHEDDPGHIYQSPPMRYLAGEPVFVGAPGSAEGAVICPEFDARNRTSSFLLFDARNVSQGPAARLACGRLLPLGFHAAFRREESSLK